jgi:hypothetical protein
LLEGVVLDIALVPMAVLAAAVLADLKLLQVCL